MALKWKGITVGPFGMNAYLLWCDETRAGLLIDPGDEIEVLAHHLAEERVQPERIILTHAHLDHVWHAREAQTRFQLPLYLHREDLPLLENLERQAMMVGLGPVQAEPPRVDGFLAEGETITFGKQSVQVVHGPGHSPGSIMLLGQGVAVVGDVLFQGSVGRTDLPGGSWEALRHTLRSKLLTLADETRILPGHGSETTIGLERRHNPFLQ